MFGSKSYDVVLAPVQLALGRLITVFFIGMILLLLLGDRYFWVESSPNRVGLGLAVAVMVITGIWMMPRIWSRASVLRVMATSILTLLIIGFLSYLGILGYLMIINGVLDRTPPTIHRLPILEVRVMRGGGYCVLVPLLDGGAGEPLSIGFTESEVGVPRVGDRLELAVCPGTLGWPWLAETPRLLPASPLSRP